MNIEEETHTLGSESESLDSLLSDTSNVEEEIYTPDGGIHPTINFSGGIGGVGGNSGLGGGMGGRGEGAQLSFSSSLYLDFNRGQGNEPREISFSGHTTINGGIGGPGGEGGSQGGAGGRGHGPQFHVSNVSAWHVHMNGSGRDETSLLPTPDALMPQVHDVVENGTPPPSVHISPETVQIREELSRLSGCIDELMDLVTGPVPLCVHSDSRGREKQRLSPWRFSPAGRGTKRRRDDESDGASSSVTGIISGTKRRRHDREVRARGKNSCRESSPNPPSLY